MVHTADTKELAAIVQETGAEVLRAAPGYPSEGGGWQLGGLDLSEHLDKYRDQELIVIIASLGRTEARQAICGICDFALNEVRQCPCAGW